MNAPSGQTGRVDRVTYPNDQTAHCSYLDEVGLIRFGGTLVTSVFVQSFQLHPLKALQGDRRGEVKQDADCVDHMLDSRQHVVIAAGTTLLAFALPQ